MLILAPSQGGRPSIRGSPLPAGALAASHVSHAWQGPGARLVVEMMGKELLAWKFVPRRWEIAPDGTPLFMEYRLRSGWEWMNDRCNLIKYATRRELNFFYRVYSAAEPGAVLP